MIDDLPARPAVGPDRPPVVEREHPRDSRDRRRDGVELPSAFRLPPTTTAQGQTDHDWVIGVPTPNVRVT
ncbi:hypothetical protein GCM10009547_36020 [Sporichthya brevicatena]|uniref:Uncharacterized protein n=1 Tax=Sporichthya brevicatena TaxID=171442 RepID=A0ABP3SDI4_9ACTN